MRDNALVSDVFVIAASSKNTSHNHKSCGYKCPQCPPTSLTQKKTEKVKPNEVLIKPAQKPHVGAFDQQQDEQTEKCELRRKSADIKHFENVTVKWNRAKSEFRQERHAQLLEKLVLQKELIRAQDERSVQRRTFEQQQSAQQREAEKTRQRSREVALQEICKQSIEEDRKTCQQNKSGNALKTEETPRHKQSYSPPNPMQRERRIGRVRPAIARSPSLPKSPMNEQDSEEEQDKDYSNVEGVPWHHAQLYRLYGESADYFIHPKIEPKGIKPVNFKLPKSEGHIGAEDLWDTLRKESNQKLLREDERFPIELKTTYSSFVRQSLASHKTPVKRNFCATEDVPDMNRLMDKSFLHRIRKLRHRHELMYRASKSNNDKTEVLMFNNPLPNLNNDMDGIGRYYPSWQDDVSEMSELEYKKWLTVKEGRDELEYKKWLTVKEGRDELVYVADKAKLNLLYLSDKPDNEMEEVLLSIRRKPDKALPKIQFLTEKSSRVPGQFTQKYQLMKEKKDLPQGHSQSPILKSQSSMGFTVNSFYASLSGIERTQSLTSRQEMLRRYSSNWQPLTMHALMEYKKNMAVDGAGEFKQGQATLWSIKANT